MTEKRKDQLESELSTNFADNNTGAITPQIYRDYMTNVMDSYSIRTAADTTYYVSSTGSDSNTGLGSGDDEAMLTVQAALAKIPKNIDHDIVLSVAAGTFGGFYMQGFSVGANGGSLTLQGATGAPTLTGGTATGTATSGTVSTLTDSGQSWTTNELLGKWVLVDGVYRQVFVNSATQITFIASFPSSTSGKAYEILEPKTIVNTVQAITSNSCVLVTGCTAAASDDIVVRNLDIQSPASTLYGFLAKDTSSVSIKTSMVTCASLGSYGVSMQGVWGSYAIEDITFNDDIDLAAVYLYQNPGRCNTIRVYAIAIDGGCILGDSCGVIQGVNSTPNACTGAGARFYRCLYVDVDKLFVPSGSSSGLIIEDCNSVSLSNLSGAGSANYGLVLTRNASVVFNSVPSISGSSGDILMGSQVLDWSDSFPADGDQAIDANLGITLTRDD
jgi:hypothetical protein